jgi:hypothetical protein
MTDNEEKPAQLDLDYTSDRAEELKENIESVQKEIDEAWGSVDSSDASVGVKVSLMRGAWLMSKLESDTVRVFCNSFLFSGIVHSPG